MTDLNPFALFWAWTEPVSSPAGHQAALPDNERLIAVGAGAGEPHDRRERELYDTRTGKRTGGCPSEFAEWRLVKPDEPAPVRTGFCGLAGKP